MSSILDAAVSWEALLVGLVIFGFAPGALLRLIVLAWHREDPRRAELLGEVYEVPRLERPFWVAQQLEIAIFEGLWGRLTWMATGRIIHRWHLKSGVEMNRRHPLTFDIPTESERQSIRPGDHVKVIFSMRNGWGERMWIRVDSVGRRKLKGRLQNEPLAIPRLRADDRIRFKAEHVIDLDAEDAIDCEAMNHRLDHLR